MTEILGCDICREGIYAGGQPRFVVATTATDLLYRCEECHTWWIGDGRSAGPVRDEVARERFPEQVLPGPVTTAEEARVAAGRLLADLQARTTRPLALWDGQFGRPGIEDHGDVWTVAWNSVAYLSSGDIFDQALAGPIAVPKDGGEPFVLDTWSTDVDELLGLYRAKKAAAAAHSPYPEIDEGDDAQAHDYHLVRLRDGRIAIGLPEDRGNKTWTPLWNDAPAVFDTREEARFVIGQLIERTRRIYGDHDRRPTHPQ